METKETKGVYLKSKPRYEILDGLRGVAALLVIIFHFFEPNAKGPAYQIVNHGYLAVDFFYVLSGFVIGYAYDDRWNKMSLWDFYKRRLVRLHPMVLAGNAFGICYYFLQENPVFQKIEPVPIWKFVLHLIMSTFMLPSPVELDVRGWEELNAFNGPTWTLTYEYLANILYSLCFRFLNKIVLVILVLISAFLTINLTLNLDVFDVYDIRGARIYTVIGGWALTSCEICVGFSRLLYPFLSGYLISRFKKSIKIPYSFIICSIILIICLSFPRIGGEISIFNGVYEACVIIIIFPLVVMIGAGSSEIAGGLSAVCKFLGEMSYPIYITHYPIIYIYFGWVNLHPNDKMFNKIFTPIGLFFIMVFNAYSMIKLYDEPVRKWLTENVLKKNKAVITEDNEKKNDEEPKLINDESSLDGMKEGLIRESKGDEKQ